MRVHKLTLGVVLLCLIVASISSVSAGIEPGGSVQVDQRIFRITDFRGRIGEKSFESVAEFERLLDQPVIAGTQVEIHSSLELVSPPPIDVHFLRLYSGLPGSSWDAYPADLMEVAVWSDYGEETYLWVPPSHDVLEMTVSFSGRIPHPIVEQIIRTDEGAAVRRTLIKKIPAEILLIEVRRSIAEFPYAVDPETWVNSSISDFKVLESTEIATSRMIKDAREKIDEIEKALVLLEDPDIQERLAGMPENVGDLFGALVVRQREVVTALEKLIEEGYPDIVLEKAEVIAEAIHGTKDVIANIETVEEFWRIIAEKDLEIKRITDNIAGKDQHIEELTTELGRLQGDLDAARGRTTVFMVLTGVFVVLAIILFIWCWFRKPSEDSEEEIE